MTRFRTALTVAVSVAALVLAGCGDDKKSEGADKSDGTTEDAAPSPGPGGSGTTLTYPVTADVHELIDPTMVFFGGDDCAGEVVQDSACRWSPEGGSGGVAAQFSVSCGFSNEGGDTFVSANTAQVEGDGGTAAEIDLGDVPAFVATIEGQVFLSLHLVDPSGRSSYCVFSLNAPLDDRGDAQPFDAGAYEAMLTAVATRSLGG